MLSTAVVLAVLVTGSGCLSFLGAQVEGPGSDVFSVLGASATRVGPGSDGTWVFSVLGASATRVGAGSDGTWVFSVLGASATRVGAGSDGTWVFSVLGASATRVGASDGTFFSVLATRVGQMGPGFSLFWELRRLELEAFHLRPELGMFQQSFPD